MSHFNLGLDNMIDSSSIFESLLQDMPNYTPTGQKKALRTSDSATEPNQKKMGLTTFNVSDILQGSVVYKPQGLVYNSFNNAISKSLTDARSTVLNGKSILTPGVQTGLVGYDTNPRSRIDIGSGATALAASVSSSAGSGTGSLGGAIPVEGSAPAGIPKGPFQPSFKRFNNNEWIQDTGVQEIPLTGEQVIQLLLAAGCELQGAVFMWGLCKRESGFFCNRAGVNNNGSTDAGLWQINNGMKRGANGELYQEFDGWKGYTVEQVCDPWVNVTLAMRMSNNGTRFVPWQTSGNYSSPDGSHLNKVNMEEARNFFLENGYQV